MVLSKIKRRVASSKLLFQQNFDRASDASAFSAHYKATIFALLFLGCAILVVGPVRSDYWVAQSLLKHGLTTNGTIESADVTTRPGKGSRARHDRRLSLRRPGWTGLPRKFDLPGG